MQPRYYQDELQYLRELGAEFAKAHPASAHLLEGTSRDPDVERLLEGFAFLTAQVRERLDDEFPEITHGLLQLLWPHYLRPVPSMAVLEFQPMFQAIRGTQLVGRGAEVESVAVEGTPCRFRTAFEVPLHPVSLDDVAMEQTTTGGSKLVLSFKLWNQAKIENLKLARLRLHVHADAVNAQTLWFHLLRHVADARAIGPNGDRPLRIEAAGTRDDEALLPYPAASFPGYRLLQEYFALPQRFLFVDLVGLDRLADAGVADRFRAEIRFDRALPASLRPTLDELRLYCTPIVNLFSLDADPIRLDRSQTEYRVRPSAREPMHHEVFSVDAVAVSSPGAGDPRAVPDFHSFAHGFERTEPLYWTRRLRTSPVDGRVDDYLAFVDGQSEAAIPPAETAAAKLTCTNRNLPKALRVGDVKSPTDSTPAFARFRNLGVPTASVPPPLGGDLPWRLVSHLSLNYLPLVDVEALRGVLSLYQFQTAGDPAAQRAGQLRLEGLAAVRATPAERLSRGSLVRGTRVQLDIQEDRFSSDGDIFLFGCLLDAFIGLQATLNAFTEVSLHGLQRGETWRWPARLGRDPL